MKAMPFFRRKPPCTVPRLWVVLSSATPNVASLSQSLLSTKAYLSTEQGGSNYGTGGSEQCHHGCGFFVSHCCPPRRTCQKNKVGAITVRVALNSATTDVASLSHSLLWLRCHTHCCPPRRTSEQNKVRATLSVCGSDQCHS